MLIFQQCNIITLHLISVHFETKENIMRVNKFILLASTAIATSISAAHADVSVITSIKPLHSLVSGVMDGVGSPNIIVDGAVSPHSYSLKPSQARDLQEADIVFWFGRDLETFLEKPIEAISSDANIVKLLDTEGLLKLNFREGGPFSEHDHDDHDDHKDHDDHDDHKDHDEHDHGEYDPHVWLDPQNASILVQKISDELSAIDSANAANYANNAAKMKNQLNELVEELTIELKPLSDEGYIVFHDAYQYFEKRFGISAVGSVTVSPEILPGVERTKELRHKVTDLEASCVFSEPQFEPKLVEILVEGTEVGTGVLDPLGASIQNGPDLYFKLIRNMASSLKNCLLKS